MATPTMITGTQALADILADSIPVSMHKDLWHLDKHRWPTMSLLMKMRRDPTDNVTFKHLEDEKIPDWVEVTGADAGTAGGVDSEITVANYDRLLEDDLLYNPRTKRRLIVETTPTSATVQVHDYGTYSTTANAVGDKLLIFSSGRKEGDDARTAISTKKVLKTFYTQWMRHTSSVTWDEADIKQYAVSQDRLYQIEQVRRRHKEQMSYTLFFGSGSSDRQGSPSDAAEGGNARRLATGLDSFITSNVWSVPSGHLTRPALFDYLINLLQYNKDASMLYAVCGFRLINIVSGWGLDLLQTTLADSGKTLGFEFPAIQIGGKKLVFIHEPIFDEHEELSQTAFICDLGKMLYRPFVGNENRDTKLYPNIKTDNNPHEYTDEVATHFGFEYFLEPAFGKITDIEY